MRRWVAVAAGVAAGVATAAALGGFDPPPEPAAPAIVGDEGGALRELLVHWVPRDAEIVLPTYRDLLAALSEDVIVRVAVERVEDFDDFVRSLGAAEAAAAGRLRAVVVGRPITIWSRDRFVTAELGGRPLLVVPARTVSGVLQRANDWIVPWILGGGEGFGTDGRSSGPTDPAKREPGPLVAGAPFAFDGGDFVADERFVYATAVLPGRNGGGRWGDAGALRAELEERFHREALLIGATREEVPDHHIGMFVTPIGGGTVLVGGAEGGEGAETDYTAETLRTLRGTLREGAGQGQGQGEDLLPGGLVPDFSEETAAKFRLVADRLRAAGLRVVTVPLVPTTTPFVYVSYNNVLIDDRADGRHVMVPQYGVEALDAVGRAVWEELGFVVHPIDVSRLYVHGGAVRCVAAVLRRGPRPTGLAGPRNRDR